MVMESSDLGNTWTTPKPLVEGDIGGRGPVRNKPIILKDGTWAAPASIEGDVWDAFVDLSKDQGATWTASNLVPVQHASLVANQSDMEGLPLTASSFKGKGVIQPTLWESEHGNVHMLLRSSEGYIYRSDSDDGGSSWCHAYKTNLPNNNSGIDLTKRDDGSLWLVYNPVSGNWAPRTPLVASSSHDNGLTWKQEFILEDEQGEYSYPAIVSMGNKLFITYTWNRKRIVFCKSN